MLCKIKKIIQYVNNVYFHSTYFNQPAFIMFFSKRLNDNNDNDNDSDDGLILGKHLLGMFQWDSEYKFVRYLEPLWLPR